MSAPPLFSARIAAGWLAAAALAFAFSFYLMTRASDSAHDYDDTGPTVYSKSALGYATFYHTLANLGISVAESTAAAGPPANAAVVVIAEPNDDPAALARVRNVLRRAPAVLLVLPKRSGDPDPRHHGRVRRAALLPLQVPARVLTLADEDATLQRYAGTAQWRMPDPLAGAPRNLVPSIGLPQLARSPLQTALMTPLLESADGVLIGDLHERERRIVVVTDPDLLENHGIVRGDNARIAAALVRTLAGSRTGRVVFDETVHGIVSRPFGALKLLFGFPFVLVTVQLALAAALLLWSGSARFGAPRPRAPSLPLGKRSLIENGSALLEHAAEVSSLTARYAEAVLRETAQAVNAPRGLARDQLVAWFDRTGRTVPAPAGAHVTAEAIYRWRNDVLDESGQRTQRR